MKPFLLYMLKWQLGAIITVPCIYFFHDYLGWNNLNTTIAFQLIGGLVFWNIDKFIFKKLKS
jgi:hypothetical protein